MANDWAEAAWVVKTLERKFKINENAGRYLNELNRIQQNIDDILFQKLAFADTANEYVDEEGITHVQPSGSYNNFQPDTVWFIIADEETEEEQENNG